MFSADDRSATVSLHAATLHNQSRRANIGSLSHPPFPLSTFCFLPFRSNAFPFMRFRTPVHDRNVLNSFCFKRLRTTLLVTEGWGTTAALIPNPEPLAPVFSLQLTYPRRIGHPKRSEGSLLISFQQLTNCSNLSPLSCFLCFHALTHCQFVSLLF